MVKRIKITVADEVGRWLPNTYICASDYDALIGKLEVFAQGCDRSTRAELQRLIEEAKR